MSSPMDTDRRIDAFFGDGPNRAPRDLLGASLRAAAATGQLRRRRWPWELDHGPRRDVALVFLGAAAAVILGGLLLWRDGLIPTPGPTDSAVPGATPSPTAGDSLAPTAPTTTLPTPRPSPAVASSAPTPVTGRVRAGAAPATVKVDGWQVIPTERGPFTGVVAAVMHLDYPILAAIGGIPQREFKGIWLYRATAFGRVYEEPVIDGKVATLATATEQARGWADRDPGRTGPVSVNAVQLPAGAAERVAWPSTVSDSGIEHDVLNVTYFVEVDGIVIRLQGGLQVGGATTEADLLALAKTLRAP